MLYAIIATDIADSGTKRAASRPRHLAYVREMIDKGRILFAGPNPSIDSPEPGPAGFSGSLIIAEFESLEAARAWSRDDPYTQDGVFESVTVKPVLKVHP